MKKRNSELKESNWEMTVGRKLPTHKGESLPVIQWYHYGKRTEKMWQGEEVLKIRRQRHDRETRREFCTEEASE
jgi:hypothetical protein